jgi:transcriptional regulator with XRE-family HTH domain
LVHLVGADHGLRQDHFAERAGISRPQLANALQGRFGLSPDAAARLRAALASLPSPAQGALL